MGGGEKTIGEKLTVYFILLFHIDREIQKQTLVKPEKIVLNNCTQASVVIGPLKQPEVIDLSSADTLLLLEKRQAELMKSLENARRTAEIVNRFVIIVQEFIQKEGEDVTDRMLFESINIVLKGNKKSSK